MLLRPPTLPDSPLPLLADGRPLPGRVRRLSLWRWWRLLMRGSTVPPGRSGLWLKLRGLVLMRGSDADVVYLSGDGTVLQVDTAQHRWQRLHCRGARQVLVLRSGMAAQLGLRPGLGLDLLV